jgi:hypothetical protein
MASDPREMWQEQPTEPQERTGDYSAKTRELERAGMLHRMRNVALSMMVIVLCLRGYLLSRFVLEQGCFAVAGIWSVAAIVVAFRRRNPEPAHFDSGLAYYRALLQVNRAAMLFTWTWLHLPILVVAVAFVTPIAIRSPQLVKNTIPFFSLLAVWLGVLGWQNLQRVRWMTREMRRLDHL